MPKRTSAGILLYRERADTLEVFLVHPGGPYWERKDEGAWSIPKGEFDEGTDALAAARREFEEETGSPPGSGDFIPLEALKQPSGKLIHAWALRGDIDASSITSNTFSMEWPPRSGKEQAFPEIDRGEWFTVAAAKQKISPGQRGFLEQLQKRLDAVARLEPG